MIHTLMPETKLDPNQWMYLSLVSRVGETIDIKITKLIDARDFIIAVSKAAGRCNADFVGVTNPSMITMMLIRAKLKKVVKMHRTTLTALIGRGIFRTVSNCWPEDTASEIKVKHKTLNHLGRICFRMGFVLKREEVEPLLRLENLINDMKTIKFSRNTDKNCPSLF